MITAPSSNLIKWAGFNMDQDCFTIATDSGIRIFNSNPLSEAIHLSEEQVGSVKIAALLHRSNIIVFVSGGIRPKYAPNTLMVWDDQKKECYAEVNVPGGPILNVFLNTTRLVLVQHKRVSIFETKPLSFLRTEESGVNPLGVGAMGGEGSCAVLVFPSFKQGCVESNTVHTELQLISVDSVRAGHSPARKPLKAHNGDIVAVAVNSQGSLLATGSDRGTLVRIFDTRTRSLLNELRRGTDPSTLQCLSFSPCASYIAVSSDKGTVHIFATRDKNRKNSLDDSQRSLAQFSLPKDTTAKLSFVNEDMSNSREDARDSVSLRSTHTPTPVQTSVIAVCSNGTFHRFSFNSEGQCERKAFDYLLQLGSEQDFWTSSF